MEPKAGWLRFAGQVVSRPALMLLLALVLLTVLAMGPLLPLDRALSSAWSDGPRDLADEARVVAKLGQRSVCLPWLFVVAVYLARRTRSWQPVLLSVAAVLALNLLVGFMKVATARDTPLHHDPTFFNVGTLYPSGHAANVVLVYGLAAYFLVHHGRLRRRQMWALTSVVAVIAVVVTAATLYLRYHWFTDMVAGFLAGGVVLRLTVDIHRSLATPAARQARDGAPEKHVYIHVGLNKTGTSYLQQSLFLSQQRLAAHGVLVPGATHRFQRMAFWDLLGRRFRGVRQPQVPGSWQRLVKTVRDWPGSRVVLSEELLGNAGVRHARRVVHDFAPAEVHVVATVRRLDRLICSMWQEEVAKGRTTLPWPEFVAAVRDPDHGPVTAGVAFWIREDLRKVIGVWDGYVPPEHIHVVVVPQPGSGPAALLERFAAATGLDAAAMTAAPVEVNTGLDLVGTEVLRRLNQNLAGSLNERDYLRGTRQTVRPALQARPFARPISLPAVEHAWVRERSEQLVRFLESSSYDVVGDLDDLLPPGLPEEDARAGDVDGGPNGAPDEGEVAEAAIAALSATFAKYASRPGDRHRPHHPSGEGHRLVRLASAGRAVGFRGRVLALRMADHNRVLARVARRYLRHTSPGSHST